MKTQFDKILENKLLEIKEDISSEDTVAMINNILQQLPSDREKQQFLDHLGSVEDMGGEAGYVPKRPETIAGSPEEIAPPLTQGAASENHDNVSQQSESPVEKDTKDRQAGYSGV